MINEIQWGTDIRDMPDMVLMGAIGDGKMVCRSKGEKKKIRGADIEIVMYGFYKDRLEDVQIHFRSRANCAKLKELLFRVYGPGRQPSRFLETYHWYGKETSVFLTYSEKTGKGATGYTFLPIYKDRQKRRRDLEEFKRMVRKFKMVRKSVYKSMRRGDAGERGEVIPERRVMV
jgi:hypothetical protein